MVTATAREKQWVLCNGLPGPLAYKPVLGKERRVQKRNFPTDICKFPTKKLALKSIKDFQFEFSYCLCREVIWNFLIRRNTKLHSKYRMHTLRADVFFRKEENIGRVYILEGAMALTRRYFTLVNILLIIVTTASSSIHHHLFAQSITVAMSNTEKDSQQDSETTLSCSNNCA